MAERTHEQEIQWSELMHHQAIELEAAGRDLRELEVRGRIDLAMLEAQAAIRERKSWRRARQLVIFGLVAFFLASFGWVLYHATREQFVAENLALFTGLLFIIAPAALAAAGVLVYGEFRDVQRAREAGAAMSELGKPPGDGPI